MAAWKDGKLMVNGQTMDAAKASRDMQKILDAISKVEPSATTSAAETRAVVLQVLESVGGLGGGQTQ
jgi:hypothetical protein